MHLIKIKNGLFVKYVATLYVRIAYVYWIKETLKSDSIYKIEDKIEEWKREYANVTVEWKIKNGEWPK